MRKKEGNFTEDHFFKDHTTLLWEKRETFTDFCFEHSGRFFPPLPNCFDVLQSYVYLM